MLAGEVIDCHVLVIGSGGAGVRAAIEASQYGDTVLISKTIVGKGGCTTMAEGGYNAVLREQDSCGIHFEDTLKGGAYLNDPESGTYSRKGSSVADGRSHKVGSGV